MSELPDRTEVLVVGAGPVGLAVAASLAGHGHDVTVVDRQATGANTSRAAVVHARRYAGPVAEDETYRLAEAFIRSKGSWSAPTLKRAWEFWPWANSRTAIDLRRVRKLLLPNVEALEHYGLNELSAHDGTPEAIAVAEASVP